MLLHALSFVHSCVSVAWFAASLAWPTRAVFFGAGTLVFTHVATGLFLALFRVRRTWRYFAWAIVVADALGLAGIALTAANLLAARTLAHSGGGSGGIVQQLARAIWIAEPALATLVLALLAATALLHAAVIGTFLAILSSPHCRGRCHPRTYAEDADADADADGSDSRWATDDTAAGGERDISMVRVPAPPNDTRQRIVLNVDLVR